jgi:Mg2+-importing ATPase
MDAINLRFLSISEQGYRMLAVAYRSISLKKSYVPDDESDLILAGFLVFTDPPKEGAKLAIAKLNSLGVNVKVLTGDNDSVAKKICQELGIPIIRCVIGSDLIHMSLNEFKAMVEETTIFARVNPEQKLDIIKVLKDNGHVTGYMGDGVNDAPSLYEADAGISVDTAVDISKEAADIILLKKDLGVLANGIEEGRLVLQQLRFFCHFYQCCLCRYLS